MDRLYLRDERIGYRERKRLNVSYKPTSSEAAIEARGDERDRNEDEREVI